MKLREKLARNLRKFRDAQGLSQEELGHRAGLDRTYIGSLEHRRYSATIDAVEKLAAALGLPPLRLLQDDEEAGEPPPPENPPAKPPARKSAKPARRKD